MSNSFKFKWDGAAILKNLTSGSAGVLQDTGEELLARSNELVPVDTGELRDSGKVVIDGDTVTVVYDAPYAARQHEDVRMNHTHGEAKFLETAVKNNLKEMGKTLADGIDELLGG